MALALTLFTVGETAWTDLADGATHTDGVRIESRSPTGGSVAIALAASAPTSTIEETAYLVCDVRGPLSITAAELGTQKVFGRSLPGIGSVKVTVAR